LKKGCASRARKVDDARLQNPRHIKLPANLFVERALPQKRLDPDRGMNAQAVWKHLSVSLFLPSLHWQLEADRIAAFNRCVVTFFVNNAANVDWIFQEKL